MPFYSNVLKNGFDFYWDTLLVREPVIGLIKLMRPKGLKVFSYVEKCAEFKY